MIIRFEWVSWKPPKLTPEAELQFAQAISAFGKAPFIKRFWGLNPPELPKNQDSFFETHAAGLMYLGVVGACFVFGDWNTPAGKTNQSLTAAQFFGTIAGLGVAVFYGSMALAVGRYTAWLAGIERKYSLPNATTLPSNENPNNNSRHYETVANEIDQGRIEKVTWTRAVAHSDGDEKVAKSLYIRYRVEALDWADAAEARAHQEAAALASARNAAKERAAKAAIEQAARDKSANDAALLGILAVGVIVLVAILSSISRDTPRARSTPFLTRSSPFFTSSTPTLSARRASLEKRISDLDAVYRQLSARRTQLNPADTAEIEAFNADAANYTERAKQLRSEKAKLDAEGAVASSPRVN